jgi:hypothetical protein
LLHLVRQTFIVLQPTSRHTIEGVNSIRLMRCRQLSGELLNVIAEDGVVPSFRLDTDSATGSANPHRFHRPERRGGNSLIAKHGNSLLVRARSEWLVLLHRTLSFPLEHDMAKPTTDLSRCRLNRVTRRKSDVVGLHRCRSLPTLRPWARSRRHDRPRKQRQSGLGHGQQVSLAHSDRRSISASLPEHAFFVRSCR